MSASFDFGEQLGLKKMKYITGILLMSLTVQGSCLLMQRRDEPSYPTNVSGWQAYTRQGVRFRGNFVLKKNETTSDGRYSLRDL
jgi:hypothetical protein